MRTGHGDLIAAADALLRPHRVGDRLFGDVGASLVTAAGNRYGGVCIDTGSGTGFCAEHSAIAAMVTAGEYQITRIVAVWRSEAGDLQVLPPCGRCREGRPTSVCPTCWTEILGCPGVPLLRWRS